MQCIVMLTMHCALRITVCIVLGGLALGLLNFGDRVGQISGLIFTMVAMLFMIYALFLYQWRAHKIRNRGNGKSGKSGNATHEAQTNPHLPAPPPHPTLHTQMLHRMMIVSVPRSLWWSCSLPSSPTFG